MMTNNNYENNDNYNFINNSMNSIGNENFTSKTKNYIYDICYICDCHINNGMTNDTNNTNKTNNTKNIKNINNIKNIKNIEDINDKNEKNIIICDECQKTNTMYTKKYCINNLHLSNIILKDVKYFKNGRTKYYLESDIEEIIQKYYDKIKKKKLKQANSKNAIEMRKKKLLEHLAEHKLEYRGFGDCFSYVSNGYPSIDVVIENELKRTSQISMRKKILYNKLQQLNLSFSETKDSICYDYINGVSDKSFNEIIDEAKIESFFIKHTDYPLLLKLYPSDIAKTKALNNYLIKTRDDEIHSVASELINKQFIISVE